MVAWSKANYNIKDSQIFTTGGSFGAFFSLFLAVARPNTIAAFGGSSGGMAGPDWPNPASTTPLAFPVELPSSDDFQLKGIVLHSEDDSTVPYSQAPAMYAEMLAKGHISELITYDGYGHGWNNTHNETQWNFFMEN